MTIGSETARSGFTNEQLFCDLINYNSKFKTAMSRCLNQLHLANGTVERAEKIAGRNKTDVRMYLSGSRNNVGCSIKSAKADFNQLDRRWLDDWVLTLNMPENIKNEIQNSIDRKGRPGHSRDPFILQKQWSLVGGFFERVKIQLLSELFTKNELDLTTLVAYDRDNRRWIICRMFDIIRYIGQSNVGITNKGIVTFGDYLSLQRKGGDGNITIPPKTSPLHPSNQLQFKVKPLALVNAIQHQIINENCG